MVRRSCRTDLCYSRLDSLRRCTGPVGGFNFHFSEIPDQSQISLFHYIPAYRRVFLLGSHRQPSTQLAILVKPDHLLGQIRRIVRLKITEGSFTEVMPYRPKARHEDRHPHNDEFGQLIGKGKVEKHVATDW